MSFFNYRLYLRFLWAAYSNSTVIITFPFLYFLIYAIMIKITSKMTCLSKNEIAVTAPIQVPIFHHKEHDNPYHVWHMRHLSWLCGVLVGEEKHNQHVWESITPTNIAGIDATANTTITQVSLETSHDPRSQTVVNWQVHNHRWRLVIFFISHLLLSFSISTFSTIFAAPSRFFSLALRCRLIIVY